MVVTGETVTQTTKTTSISSNNSPENIHVLHLDDDDNNLELTKAIVEQFDPHIEITSVNSISEAMKKLQEDGVDLILSDYDMPDTNGIEFAKKVKSTYKIPFILYTGRGSETVAEMAYAANIDDYLHKDIEPAHFQVLAKRIRHAVEKRHSEEGLLRSEQRLRLILDSSPEGVIVNNLGRAVYVNKQFAEMMGYTVDELLNKPIIELHEEKYRELVEDRTRRRHMGEDVPDQYEVELVRKDGSILPVEYSVSPIVFNGERASLTFIRDVSQRREKLELEIKIASLHRHAHVLNEQRSVDEVAKITLEILQSNINGNFICVQLASGGYLHIIEKKGDEPVGTPMSIQGRGLTARAAREKKTILVNDTRSDPDYIRGGRYTLSELAVPILCRGELLGVLNAENLELNAFSENDRILMEALADEVGSTIMRIRRDEQALETARFYELVYENIDNGIYVTNSQDLIIYVNKGVLKIAGIEPSKMLNRNAIEVLTEPRLAAFYPLYLFAKETLKTKSFDFVPVVTSTGISSYQSGEIIPLEKNGIFDGAIIVVKDATERKMYIGKLEENNRKLNALHRQALELSDSKCIEDVGVCVVNALVNTLGLTECSFAVVDDDKIRHVVSHFGGETKVYRDGESSFVQDVYGKGIVSRSVREVKTQVVDDVRKDMDFIPGTKNGSDLTLCEMVVPVIVGGRVIAVINVEHHIVGAFSVSDVQMVEILAMHVSAHFNAKEFEIYCPTSKYLTKKIQ